MLRLFLTSSHISTMYMIMYAKNTNKSGMDDILLMDFPRMKKSLVDLITDTSNIYSWKEVINFAKVVSDDYEYLPTTTKKYIRLFKNNIFLKPFYNILLKIYEARTLTRHKKMILKRINTQYNQIELNLLTKTGLNKALIEIFPHANVNYFEHGLGDYMYLLNNQVEKDGQFYCVFSNSFKKYLASVQHHLTSVYPVVYDVSEFKLLSKKVIQGRLSQRDNPSIFNIPNNSILLLLDSVDIYNVLDNFWTDFIDVCLKNVQDYHQYTYIIKPHHMQSFRSIKIVKTYLDQLGVAYTFIDSVELMSFSAEVLFSAWREKVKYVFSIFSSSVYYLSILYEGEGIIFYHGYDFFKAYLAQAPLQFVSIFKGLEELTNKVFSVNCKNINI